MATAALPFAALLKRHRLAAGLTQEALAERAGLSARAVSDLERDGGRIPRLDTLALLAEALGLAPEQRAALAAAARPEAGPSGPVRPRHNLPFQVTSFVGRERELEELPGLLATTRLLTLTGVGGGGKTRLALRLAAAVVEDYADGAWLVELAPLADPALVPQALATAIAAREEPGRSLAATVVDKLRPRRLLLVLDNCEHVLAACADLAGALLQTCPDVRILATSREPLRIAGETSWQVPSLSLPDPRRLSPPATLPRYEAVRLFLDRATAVQPRFAITDENARAVVELCRRLDGIPLAIELAAARMGALTPEQLLVRLEDRFRLLTNGSRTALPRHQTLAALVTWSYDLLTEAERRLFARLSVFSGGFTVEAAEAVGAGDGIEPDDVLDLLLHLIEKSLVVAEEARESGAGRYRLLETLRQYAHERLAASGDRERVQGRHAGYYQRLAAERGAEPISSPLWQGRGDPRDRGILELEHANLRTALGWLLARRDTASAARMALALKRFWYEQGYITEGSAHLRALLSNGAASIPAAQEVDVLSAIRMFAYLQGDPSASAFGERSLVLRRRLGDSQGVANELAAVALLARDRGDYAAARAMLDEALARYRALGDRGGMAVALSRLGTVAHALGTSAAAQACYEESLALARELGERFSLAWVPHNMGLLALDQGELVVARARFAQALPVFEELGQPFGFVHALAAWAILAVAEGRPERALRLAGAATALREATAIHVHGTEQDRLERGIAKAREGLAAAVAAGAWAAGRAMTLEDAVADALDATDRVGLAAPSTAGPFA